MAGEDGSYLSLDMYMSTVHVHKSKQSQIAKHTYLTPSSPYRPRNPNPALPVSLYNVNRPARTGVDESWKATSLQLGPGWGWPVAPIGIGSAAFPAPMLRSARTGSARPVVQLVCAPNTPPPHPTRIPQHHTAHPSASLSTLLYLDIRSDVELAALCNCHCGNQRATDGHFTTK